MDNQNKKVITRLFNEGMSQKKMQVFDEIIDPKFVHKMMPGKQGPKAFSEVLQSFFNGFPDMNIELQNIIAEGDYVATRGYWTGTHKGNFMNIPASGKKVKIEFVDFWKMSNGKCVENWVEMDIPGLLQQIGAMQPMM